MKQARIVVVGSINMDMIAHARRLPLPGETLPGEDFEMAPGGKGANQAVAAARLGAAVSFVARVGTRVHGRALIAALRAEGVDAAPVIEDEAALPGIAVIMVGREGGENSIVYIPGSNAALAPADVQQARAAVQQAQVVVGQLEVPQAAVLEAFRLAREQGVRTLLNAAPALAVDPALLAATDVLVVNETEAAQLAGLADAIASPEATARAAAEVLRARGLPCVLVTLGAQGVLIADTAGLRLVPAPRVQAVDTVGAGDTFVGGVATAWAEGHTLDEAVRLGQAAAAIAVSRVGVQSAMPRRDELGAEFAARHP